MIRILERITMVILLIAISLALYGNYILRDLRVTSIEEDIVTIKIGHSYYDYKVD